MRERRIAPTSTTCLSAWQPNLGKAPLIDAENLFRQPGPAQVSLSIVIARLTGNYGRWASGVPASGQPTEYCN